VYILAGAVAVALYQWFAPFSAETIRNLAAFAMIVEVIRTVVVAAWRGQPDAWIIGIGLLLFMFGTAYDVLLDLRWMEPFGSETNGYYYGFVGLLILMALYLARGVARGHALEAEHERQRRELEAARDLQLSMLPSALPDHPGVELAAHMQTATEVGGDYYDFFVADDGCLTLAIGDATGHGLQAGTMVTATKSLFSTMAREPDLAQALSRSSEVLRRMGLTQLYMALAVVRLRDGVLQTVGAGMPPALLFRAVSGEVKEIPLKGLPLGAPGPLHHSCTETPVGTGDTLLFMSDGFPELRSQAGELLGYDRVRESFRTAAEQTPAEIISHLKTTGAVWSNERVPSDDITFVVMKMRP
jgi:serine phosphatase RsbU (regulator of sigma subunit)